ncbi:MAG: RidA family protein [Lautropia sp.]
MSRAIERFPSDLPLPFSKAVRAGGFLFLSGQIAMDDQGRPLSGDIATQTHAVLRGIGKALAEHGAGFEDVIRATVWLADLDDFAAFNAVYKEYFAGGYPTRSTVQAGLAFGAKVEIEVQAWTGDR